MIKTSLYPKTTRFGNGKIAISEKIDGSNLTFFVKFGKLYVGQRSTVYGFDEIDDVQGIMYKGLYGWLKENGEDLQGSIFEGSAICGEWLGMGRISYGNRFEQRFLMFGKGRISGWI